MNKEQILSVKPGPELDRLVAERVMGWQYDLLRDAWAKADGSYAYAEVWKPSTDIAAAWDVVQCLISKSFNVEVWNTVELDQDGEWRTAWVVDVRSTQHGASTYRAQAPSAPLAICRAALLAVQSKEEAA